MSTEINLSKPILDSDPCDTCSITKLHSRPHKNPIQPGKLPLELIHSDVLGPFTLGWEGSRYIVTFLCDATQLSEVYLVKHKSEVFNCFKHFKQKYETPDRLIRHIKIRRFRTDNGGEYSSQEMADYLFQYGITHEFTVPGNPQQNGASERLGGIIWEKAESFLKLAGLPAKFWPEMVKTANYIRMRSPQARVQTTPYEAWHGEPPRYSHLRAPGTKCWAIQRLRSKQVENGIECKLLGYEGDSIYRLLTLDGKVIRASTVRFAAEKRSLADTAEPEEHTPKRLCDHSVHESSGDNYIQLIQDTSDTIIEGDIPETEATPSQNTRESHPRVARTAEYHPLERALISYDIDDESPKLFALLATSDPSEPYEPRTFREAASGGAAKQWESSMQDEVNSLKENNTWYIVDRPKDRAVLSGKWVYRHKRGPNREVIRYKSRWVVRGFEQREGLDYNDTFASVVKPMSYKLLFAIAAAYDLEIEQMDVKTAFLYGDIDVEVYVEQPDGFNESGQSDKVCKLRKALYGLKQSPRVWYFTLTTYLESLGFKPLTSDNCIFFDSKGNYIAIFVDDLLIIGPSLADINDIKAKLNERFHMTDLGPCKYYLGMEVTRDRPNRTLKLSQRGYIEKVLREFGMWDCSQKNDTPIDAHNKLRRADAAFEPTREEIKWYQKAVGSLMYAMLGTRPDIAFAVSVVSRYAARPTQQHRSAVQRIFRYLRKTVNYVLVFRGELAALAGYTDSDWAGDLDTRRSTSGYLFSVGSAVVSWSSKLQSTVALSTCEAEYIGQSNAAKEAIWLRRLLDEIRPEDMDKPKATIIFCDNQGAIALAKNPQFHSRMKHVEIQHNFVREKVSDGAIQLEYVNTESQVADGLTKALDKGRFERFRKAIGLELA
jgi:hypothetical protein